MLTSKKAGTIPSPDGTQDKHEFYGYSREEVLTLGERDIKANWKRYRAAYEQEMGR